MLKDFEKSKPEEKDVLNDEIKALRARLIGQQQLIREKESGKTISEMAEIHKRTQGAIRSRLKKLELG